MFTKPKLAINGTKKTRIKITKILIEAELKNKYKEKKRLTQETKENQNIIYSKLSFISKIVVNYKLRKTLKGKCQKWSSTHTKNIEELQTENPFIKPNDISGCSIKSVTHNFSSDILSKEEEIAFSYGHVSYGHKSSTTKIKLKWNNDRKKRE